jgi:hypothetical protein
VEVVKMTKEERREYMRAWRAKNKDRIKEKEKQRTRQKYLASVGDFDAVLEWVATHIKGKDWTPIEGHRAKNGKPVVILYNEKADFPYSVQYAGGGSYYKTIEEARIHVPR